MSKFSSKLNGAFPASQPSDALRARVATLAARPPRRKTRFLRVSFATMGAGLSIAAAVLLAPRAATASTLAQIQRATQRIPSYRMITYDIQPDGSRRQTSTAIFAGGILREERGGRVNYTAEDRFWSYSPKQKQAVVYSRPNRGQTLTTLSGLLSEFRRSNWLQGVKVTKIFHEGRPALVLSALSKNEPIALRIYADQKTDLPFHAEILKRTLEGDLRLQSSIEIDCHTRIDPAVTRPTFPKGTRIVDHNQLEEDWRSRLSRPIATLKQGEAQVMVRDVTVNEDGVVFVLYTNGMVRIPLSEFEPAPGQPGVRVMRSKVSRPYRPTPTLRAVTDEDGNEYVPVEGLQGTMYTTQDELVRGFVFGGEDLQAAAFAPVRRSSSPAKEIQLVFADSDTRLTHVHPSEAPDVEAIPDWQPFVGMCPGHPTSLQADVEYARYRKLQAVPQAAERALRRSIELTRQYAAEDGHAVIQGWKFLDLGRLLKRQGRNREALQAFRTALEETNPVNKHSVEEIQQEIDSLSRR